MADTDTTTLTGKTTTAEVLDLLRERDGGTYQLLSYDDEVDADTAQDWVGTGLTLGGIASWIDVGAWDPVAVTELRALGIRIPDLVDQTFGAYNGYDLPTNHEHLFVVPVNNYGFEGAATIASAVSSGDLTAAAAAAELLGK